MRKIQSKAKTNIVAVTDNIKQEELETRFKSILVDMSRIKQDIGKGICELQKKEQEFAEAHKQILEQIKESYHTLDWISNLLMETAGRRSSENNNGLNPIIGDIQKTTGSGKNGQI